MSDGFGTVRPLAKHCTLGDRVCVCVCECVFVCVEVVIAVV